MEIEANEAIILFMRAQLYYRINHPTAELAPDELRKTQAEYDRLGSIVRKMLRKRGYQRDNEIDTEMVRLSNNLLKAYNELFFHILENSPKFRTDSALIGLTDMNEWHSFRAQSDL